MKTRLTDSTSLDHQKEPLSVIGDLALASACGRVERLERDGSHLLETGLGGGLWEADTVNLVVHVVLQKEEIRVGGKKDNTRESEPHARRTGLKRPMTGRGRTLFEEETILSKSLRLRSVVVPLESAEARRSESSVRQEESEEFGKKTERRKVQRPLSKRREARE
jgi:hypothetical protein